MRRRPSKRTKIVLLGGLLFLAGYAVWWFPELTLLTCREASLLCECTFVSSVRAETSASAACDDAGRSCDAGSMVIVELRVESDICHFIGHTYIQTPSRAVGFRTDTANLGLMDYLNPLARIVVGRTRDDTGHAFDRVRRYRVGPETLRRLEASIDANTVGPYQLGDWGEGRNCATWACDRLRDAGLTPPFGDRPNKLAMQMESAAAPSDLPNAR